ncbi:MAG: hypothetical protein IT211_12920, partial [Armatimonadetes bacterium]|nr:hypothetical protein [Armatimonadota bacterium]
MTLQYLLNTLRDHKIQGTFAGLSTELIWQQFLNPTFQLLGWQNLSPLAITMPTPSLRLAPTHYIALHGASSNLTQLRHRSTSHMLLDDNNLAIITDFDNWELLFRNETIAEYRAEEFLADDDRTETSVFLELKRLIGNAAVTSGAWIHTAEELWRKRVDEAEIDAWVKEFNQLRKALGSVLIANPTELPQPKQQGRPRTAYTIMGITAKPEHRDRDEMTLNHIIQRLIDRFIIFRFAEDNNILVNGNEKPLSDLYYRALMDKPNLAKQNTVWRNISHGEKSLFAQFADAYNGGVFQSLDGHHPDPINQLPLRDDLIHQIVDTIVRRPVKKKLARLLGYIYEKYIGKRLYIIANDADAQRVAATAGLNAQQTAALRQRLADSSGPIVELANTP